MLEDYKLNKSAIIENSDGKRFIIREFVLLEYVMQVRELHLTCFTLPEGETHYSVGVARVRVKPVAHTFIFAADTWHGVIFGFGNGVTVEVEQKDVFSEVHGITWTTAVFNVHPWGRSKAHRLTRADMVKWYKCHT